jgi:hypothetical protein
MVAVAIAGIDFGVIRAMLGSLTDPTGFLLVVGGLPMVNVLVVGLLIAQQRPSSRPFLLGFEAFGAMGLAVYIFLATFFPGFGGPIMSYLDLMIDPWSHLAGPDPSLVFVAIAWSLAIVMVGGPQLVFALIGGFLTGFKITLTQR